MNKFVLSVSRYLFPALVIACWATAATPPTAHAATLVVDVDGLATAADCNGVSGTFNTIQGAVNAAMSGDTIQICPGNYDEQVIIRKSNLTIRGSGAGSTVLRPTAVAQNTSTLLSGALAAPILLIDGAANVTIANLTIDGAVADSGAVLFPVCRTAGFYMGIYYRNSSGAIDTSHVTNITSSTTCAIAIRAEFANILVTRNLVDRYGTSGVSCAGPNTQCSITGNTVRGLGPVTDQAQSGIELRDQTAGVISGNVVTDHFRIGAKGAREWSVGIFLVYAQTPPNPHELQENVFANNQVNVQRIGDAAAVK